MTVQITGIGVYFCECYMDSLRNITYTEQTHNEKIIAIKQ